MVTQNCETPIRHKWLACLMFSLIPIAMPAQSFDLQGHRGCRGLMPENSIPGFIKAMELGVTTLEMDVVVSVDSVVVVSHEPWFSPKICLDEMGLPLTDPAQKLNIYRMYYEDIRHFDCGSGGNPDFPQQQKMAVHKPSLAEAIEAIEAHAAATGRKDIRYNIELKSTPLTDNAFHPSPEPFVDIVFRTVNDMIGFSRVTIQSFDIRILQQFRRKYPEVHLSLLVEKGRNPEQAIATLGFSPEIYSPHFSLLKAEHVHKLQSGGVRVIPWTVNRISDMQKMLSWGVDGLITDYPDRFTKLSATQGNQLSE